MPVLIHRLFCLILKCDYAIHVSHDVALISVFLHGEIREHVCKVVVVVVVVVVVELVVVVAKTIMHISRTHV